jgi:integrase
MPPKYLDGSFRNKSHAPGLLEYRFMHEGSRISVYGHSKNECWNKRTEIIKGKRRTGKKFKTYGQWLREWHRLYNSPKLGVHALQLSEMYIYKYIIPQLGDKLLDKINGLDIQNFLNGYNDKTNTMNKIAGVIKRSLEKAFALQLIKFNPFAAVDVKKHKYKRIRALTFEEQTLIYEKIDAKYRGVFFFCCCTGLRISEALSIKISDFDFNNKKIYASRLKKDDRNNIIPVPFINKLLEEININHGGKYLFDTNYQALKTYLRRFYEKHNITGVMTHTFRHTFASNCYYAGIKDKNIQAILGHSTVGMTLDIYTQLMGCGNSPLLDYIKALKAEFNL